MNKRQNKIIKLLDNNRITGKNLALLLGVSDRTIRNDIRSINDELGYTAITADKLGYIFKGDNIVLQQNNLIETPEGRRKFILKKLLLHESSINIYDLIDEIYVSETTLLNDINDINSILSEYNDVSVVRSNQFIKLHGSEKNIRQLYKDLLIKETENNLFNINQIASLYTRFNLLDIKNILEDILCEYNYSINDVSFPILMIHLGVCIDRIISGKEINYIDNSENIKDSIEYRISEEFFNKINNLINVNVNKGEIVLFAKNLMSKNSNRYKDISNSLEYKIIVKDLLKYLYESYGINFLSDEELVNGLCLHVEALISRIKLDSPASNLFLDEIKKRYPFIFELALVSSDYLNTHLDIEISEEEVGFLCLHLGTAYERTYQSKFKVLLITPDLNVLHKNIEKSINKSFSDKLKIVKSLNYFEEKKVIEVNPDIIISSIPLYHSLDITTVYISPFFDDRDESNLLKAINNLEKKKLKEEYGIHLQNIFNSENFYCNLNFKNKNEVIKFLCDKLETKGYVNNNYYSSVMEREKMSATSFAQGFAIPHSLSSDDINRSCISVLILDNPITWDSYDVQIIFLLTIKDVNSPVLKLFFNWMENISNNLETFSKLIECKNFDKFIEIFSNEK